MDLITLRRGDTDVTLAPRAGGGIAAFRWQGVDVMRPASHTALANLDPLGLASFPLVPWSNRIANGRFTWEGRDVKLPLNFGEHPHAIHGHGWQRPWEVEAQDTTSATLSYRHEAAEWPWTYRAEQRVELVDDGLDVRLSLENRSDRPMPAGLGHHPYYLKTPGMRLEAHLEGWWETDEFIMPVRYVEERRDDWSEKLHSATTTDNVFAGWDGTARIIWPERNIALVMTTSEAARWMVIYSPPDQPITCIEGVTHPTDPFNEPDHPGLAIVEPGASFVLDTRFRVEPL